MIFVVTQYWPFLAVAFGAGIAIGWWGQAAAARRKQPEAGEGR